MPMQSSSLAQVAYDPCQSIPQVEFRDGATYQYADVPVETYRDLLQADSKGAYFNRCVRNIFRHALVRAAPAASKQSPNIGDS